MSESSAELVVLNAYRPKRPNPNPQVPAPDELDINFLEELLAKPKLDQNDRVRLCMKLGADAILDAAPAEWVNTALSELEDVMECAPFMSPAELVAEGIPSLAAVPIIILLLTDLHKKLLEAEDASE